MSAQGVRVAYQGEPGAFSEEAVVALFGGRARPVPCATFEDVGAAVLEGRVRYGLLPVENTAAGSIAASYDVLVRGGLRVVGEVTRPVRHALVGLPGARVETLRRVLSHPVALAQCTGFLASRRTLLALAAHDTAGAARTVAETADPSLAALASRAAGERYGLVVLADDVQDRPDNQTRFFLVAAAGAEAEIAGAGEVRTVLLAETYNRPGALAALLVPFAERGVNLTRLESRPGREPWTYRFFLELQGDASTGQAGAALDAVRRRARSVVVLGRFTGRHPGASGPPPASLDAVGIIGLGLMGGSLARELAARRVRVLGWDRNPDVVRAALDAGVLTGVLTGSGSPGRRGGPGAASASDPPDLPGLDEVDGAVLAVPAQAASELLGREAARLSRRALVMDVASTKRAVVETAARLGIERFVGAHPLAGSERAGWAASRLGLFAGVPVYLCAQGATDPAALSAAEAFWRALGGRPERIDATEHDGRLAWTSHLPQLTSTILGLALAAGGTTRSQLGRGGRDVSRLAGSDPELWTGIAMDNKDLLAPAVGALETALHTMRTALEDGDRAALAAAFERAARWAAVDD